MGCTQKSAWFLGQRIRKAWEKAGSILSGEVEADETYIGGKEKNKRTSKRLHAGRGTVGKAAVVGIKDRETNQINAKVVESTDKATIQGFVVENTTQEATAYTDEATAYIGLPRKHLSVKHSAGEYVRDQIHTNGIESFWSLLKRGYYGTHHFISHKHIHQYVSEFSTRQSVRRHNTIDVMKIIAQGMVGRQLKYKELIA